MGPRRAIADVGRPLRLPALPFVHRLPGDADRPRDRLDRLARPHARDRLQSPRRGQSCILVDVHRASGSCRLSGLDNPSLLLLRSVNNLLDNYSQADNAPSAIAIKPHHVVSMRQAGSSVVVTMTAGADITVPDTLERFHGAWKASLLIER